MLTRFKDSPEPEAIQVASKWPSARLGTIEVRPDEAAQQCGWLKDKYGVSWQVVPVALIEMMTDPDYVNPKG